MTSGIYLSIAVIVFVLYNTSVDSSHRKLYCNDKNGTYGICLPAMKCAILGGNVTGNCPYLPWSCCSWASKSAADDGQTDLYCESIVMAPATLLTPDVEYFLTDRLCKIMISPSTPKMRTLTIEVNPDLNCYDGSIQLISTEGNIDELCNPQSPYMYTYDLNTGDTLELIFKTKATEDYVETPDWEIKIFESE